MGNLERPLTWGLGLLFIVGLFLVNCECGDGTTCTFNGAFNISSSDLNANALEVDVPEIVTEVIEEVTIDENDTTVVIEASGEETDVEEDVNEDAE